MEYFEKHTYDADIYVNYKTKTIHFENQKTYSNLFKGTLEISLLLSIALVIFGIYNAYWRYSYPMDSIRFSYVFFPKVIEVDNPISFLISYLSFIPLLIVICVLMFTGPMVFSSSNYPPIRNFVQKSKRSYASRVLEIENPSGTLTYETRNDEPLIDLEYNDDIANALKTSSLIKTEKPPKKLFRNVKYRPSEHIVLTIVFSRPTKGKIKITEY